MSKAKWTAGRPTLGTDAAGVFSAVVPLMDNSVHQGDFTFTISADRVLTVTWTNKAGTVGLTDFRAWSTRERS